MAGNIFLGIDGGGTKTKASLVTDTGAVLSHDVWGAINYNSNAPARITKTMQSILQWAALQCNGKGYLSGIGIAAAGISNVEGRNFLSATVQENQPNCPFVLVGDHEAALTGAFGKREGIILIVGTGSICFGVDAQDRTMRTGGWGHMIDDLGSGYDLGCKILSAIVKAHDGRAPKTALTQLVFQRFNLTSMEDLVGFVFAPTTQKQTIADVSVVLSQGIAQRDACALEIGEKAVQNWVELVIPVVENLDMQNDQLALCGGVCQNNECLKKMFSAKINGIYPRLKIGMPSADASVGAALIAKTAADTTHT